MVDQASDLDKILSFFSEYCAKQNYQKVLIKKNIDMCILSISNGKYKITFNIYSTNKLNVQGQDSDLKKEFEELKVRFESNPISLVEGLNYTKKPKNMKYTVIENGLQNKIVEILCASISNRREDGTGADGVKHVLKLNKDRMQVSIVQYSTGNLLVQGKEDSLFEDCCEIIDRIALPSENEIAKRYLSTDEKICEFFDNKYTEELKKEAKQNILNRIGKAFNYLYEHDKKYLVSGECIQLSLVPMEEYSPIVMPLSKGLEGFVKKIMIDIGLVARDYFDKENEGFRILTDKNDKNRLSICKTNQHLNDEFYNLNRVITEYRHYFMHSDKKKFLETREDAEKVTADIYQNIKGAFEVFDKIYNFRTE